MRADQVKHVPGKVVVEVGGVVYLSDEVRDLLVRDGHHLLGDVEPERLNAVAAELLQADQKSPGADPDVEDAQRQHPVAEQILPVDLIASTVGGGSEHVLGIEVVKTGDDFIVLPLNDLSVHAWPVLPTTRRRFDECLV